MSSAAIELINVSVVLNNFKVLNNVNASVPSGKVTALIGPNGAGKTTLILAILGIIPYQGRILFYGKDAMEGRQRIGYIPQHLDFDRGLPLTVLDFLALSSQRLPLWIGYSRSAKKLALAALEEVGAGHLSDRKIGYLSGGELQRVMLAMAISRKPDVLILDEPAAGVDVDGEALFCNFLSRVQKEANMTMILVSHDLSIVSGHAEHVICLNRNVKCQGGVLEVLTPETIMGVYGPHASLYKHLHTACTHEEKRQ